MTSEPNPYTAWVRQLVSRHWGVDGGQLLVDGCSCARLAAEFGTPLYAYSQRTLESSWQSVRGAFPAPLDIYFSIKANPQQAFLRFFLERGCGLEVASAGELQQSLAAGCAPERILFAGPGKTDDELRLALEVGLGEVHVESLGELARLISLAEAAAARVAVALRVNPRLATATGAMQMGGRPSPFGMDESDLDAAIQLAGTSARIDLAGLHLNTGTQLLDADQLLEYYRYAVELAEGFARRLGAPLKTLDFGGGLGIPYFTGQDELDMERVGAGIADLMRVSRRRRGLENGAVDDRAGAVFSGAIGTLFDACDRLQIFGRPGIHRARRRAPPSLGRHGELRPAVAASVPDCQGERHGGFARGGGESGRAALHAARHLCQAAGHALTASRAIWWRSCSRGPMRGRRAHCNSWGMPVRRRCLSTRAVPA
jgi:hypothetical protein